MRSARTEGRVARKKLCVRLTEKQRLFCLQVATIGPSVKAFTVYAKAETI
jgi:hypothetical protein